MEYGTKHEITQEDLDIINNHMLGCTDKRTEKISIASNYKIAVITTSFYDIHLNIADVTFYSFKDNILNCDISYDVDNNDDDGNYIGTITNFASRNKWYFIKAPSVLLIKQYDYVTSTIINDITISNRKLGFDYNTHIEPLSCLYNKYYNSLSCDNDCYHADIELTDSVEDKEHYSLINNITALLDFLINKVPISNDTVNTSFNLMMMLIDNLKTVINEDNDIFSELYDEINTIELYKYVVSIYQGFRIDPKRV